MKSFRFFLLLTAAVSGAMNLEAQSPSGGPQAPATAPGDPASSVALGVDNINYFNGHLSISIPLAMVGGRSEAARSISLPIQTQWTVDPTTLAPTLNISTQPASNGYETYSGGGWAQVQTTSANWIWCGSYYVPTSNVLTWVVWTAPDGTQTLLADDATNGQPAAGSGGSCSYTFTDRGRSFHSYDGSSLTFLADSDITDNTQTSGGSIGTLYFPNGTRYRISGSTGSFVSQITDRNGNYSSQNFTGYISGSCSNGYVPGGVYNVTDSAGNTETINYTTNPPCNPEDTIVYTGTGGATRTATVNYDWLHNHLASGLPLGASAQTAACLFPELYGSSSTTYDFYVVSSISLPNGGTYSFTYNYYGEVTQMTLPTGGAIGYVYSYPTSCTDTSGKSGAILWSGGTAATIYRRVLERDEYANGPTNGLTGKTTFTAISHATPDSFHTGRSNGLGTQLDVDFEDASGNQLRHETHLYYGDPTAQPSVPADPTVYPVWSDGYEVQAVVSQGTPPGTARQTQTNMWQQQPCSGCWFNPQSDNSRLYNPLVCQTNTTLDTGNPSTMILFFDALNNLTDRYEYDFGAGPVQTTNCPSTAASGWFRHRSLSYWYASNSAYGEPTTGAPGNASLINLPATDTTVNAAGSGSIDKYAYDQTTIVSATGAPGHDDTDFPVTYTTRGNLTTHQSYQSTTGTYPGETFTWDMTGREITHVDFDSNTTTYGYTDAKHINPNSVKNALNQTRSYTYDSYTYKALTLTDEQSPAVVTQYSYSDPLERLTSVVRASGTSSASETTWAYYIEPGYWQVVQRQDQSTYGDEALRTDTFYDGLGRYEETQTYETSSSVITSARGIDAMGRTAWVGNPARSGDPSYSTNYAYDVMNRVTCATTTFDSAQTCTTYNANVATTTDPAGNVKAMTTDAAGRLKQVTEDPSVLAYVTAYVYDALDDLTQVTQGSQTRTFNFDSRGRIASAVNPESGTTSYTWDANNNLLTRSDNAGVTATYGYDALNRVSSVTYSGSRTAPNVTYSYDTGIANSVGRLVSVASSAATEAIAGYDPLGRITGSSETIGSSTYSFSYTWNRADALLTTTYPVSGRVVTNGYDGANRVSSVTGSLGGTTKTYASNVAYAAFGGYSSLPYNVISGAPGGTRSFTYNGRMQVTDIHDQGPSLLDLAYSYGAGTASHNNGNPTQIVETAQAGTYGTQYSFTQTYGYDHANRLSTSTDSGGWTQNFNYDQFGNLWTATNTGLPGDHLPASNVYNSHNQVAAGWAQYDSAGTGNQTVIGSSSLTYDAESRIVRDYDTVTHNTTNYIYDGLGKRVSKAFVGGATVTYIYDAFGNLTEEYTSGTAATPACATCYLTPDAVGSIRMISTALAGGFTSFHDFAGFGEEVIAGYSGRPTGWGTNSNGPDNLNQRFTGAERDTETGLDNMQARYLANLEARFMRPDPAGNFVADPTSPQSWNLYSYAWNNPLQFLDPSGLDPCYDYICLTNNGNGGWADLTFGSVFNNASFGLGISFLTVYQPNGAVNEEGSFLYSQDWYFSPASASAGTTGTGGQQPAAPNNVTLTPQAQGCQAKIQGAVNNALNTNSTFLGPTSGPGMSPTGYRNGAYNFNYFAPGVVNPVAGSTNGSGRFPGSGLHIPLPGGADPTISPWGYNAAVEGSYFTAHFDSANPTDDLVGFLIHFFNDVLLRRAHGC